MVVMILDAVPRGLRGEITRWLAPIGSTAFVGDITAEVRQRLWDLCVRQADGGRVALVWTSRNERGWELLLHGYESTTVVDLDGLKFTAVRDAGWEAVVKRFGL